MIITIALNILNTTSKLPLMFCRHEVISDLQL